MEFCKVKIRRALAGLATGALVTACAVHDRTPPDEIVFALGSNPTNLDPRLATDSYSEKIDQLLFNGLMARASDGQLTPDLASGLEIPDPLTYRFALRTDVRFHDGTPLTSEDVRATFAAILDPSFGSIKRLAYDAIAGVDTPDPHTVIFHLRRPHAPFLSDLTVGILPASRAHTAGDAALIGTGPYRLTDQLRDQYVRLEAAPDCFKGPPLAPRIIFKIVPDATVRALELIHGSVDMTQNDLPAFLIPAMAARAGLNVLQDDSTLVKYLAFNLRDPLTADLRIRRAIAMGIDRDEIIRYKYRGFASPSDSLLTPASFAFDPSIAGYSHDPEAAARLLDEAGYRDPDGPGPRPRFTLIYKTSLDDVAVAVARVFQAQLRVIGIDLQVQTNEWGVFFDDIKRGNFQLYSLTAVGVRDPDYYSYLYHSSRVPPEGANRARYHNPAMDRLLDEGRQTMAPEARRRIYAEVQRLALADLPYLPLWREKNVAVLSPGLNGYALTPNGELEALSRVRKRPLHAR
jgi:peptide/nickel transport system substrate-binding protein